MGLRLVAALPPPWPRTGRPDHGLRLPAPGTTFTMTAGTKVVARGMDGMDCA